MRFRPVLRGERVGRPSLGLVMPLSKEEEKRVSGPLGPL